MIGYRDGRPGDSGSGTVWLVTFADLVALLLAFFVMIYATQRIEQGPWQALIDSLSRSFNPERGLVARQPVAHRNIREMANVRGADLGYLEALLRGVVDEEPALSGILLHRFEDRLVIAFPARLLFPPGEATPAGEAATAVAALAAVLRNVGNRIDVFGHTDPEPVSGTRFPSNRALSLARARTVVRMLHEAGYRRRITAFGLADSRFDELAEVEPRARRLELARRVDIVVRPSRERY